MQAPPERRELPLPCRGDGVVPCPQLDWRLSVPIVDSPAHSWRRLGLIERDGTPTRRGIVCSFFQHGEGLAVAAALEDERYPIAELIFDLANLRAGPRFAGDDSPYSGRLAIACQRLYGHDDVEGYLQMGVPLDYGAGASEALRGIIELGLPRQKLLTEPSASAISSEPSSSGAASSAISSTPRSTIGTAGRNLKPSLHSTSTTRRPQRFWRCRH